MDSPAPDALIIDLATQFISNRTQCPVVTYSVKTSIGDPATANEPTSAETLIFSI